jgi:glucose/arabinose dehydrogenase
MSFMDTRETTDSFLLEQNTNFPNESILGIDRVRGALDFRETQSSSLLTDETVPPLTEAKIEGDRGNNELSSVTDLTPTESLPNSDRDVLTGQLSTSPLIDPSVNTLPANAAVPTVAFSQPTVNIDESDRNATVTVSRTAGSDRPFSVDYATGEGTAIAGEDYRSRAGTLSFARGETSKTIVVPILNNSQSERDETINLTLSNPTGAVIGAQDTAIVTQLDDDSSDIDFNFSNFADVSNLVLNGSTAKVNNILRITPAATFRAGSAFYGDRLAVGADTSFSTQFQFRLSGGQGTNGADGITFMVQNSAAGANARGEAGGYLGYDDNPTTPGAPAIDSSLAIEFDTFKNTWDVGGNQISVLRDGDVTQTLAESSPTLDLNSGSPLNAWIEYDGTNDRLEVFLANNTTRPRTPSLTTTVDLSAVVNGESAFVGFSGGTGGRTNLQDIESWNFSSSPTRNPGTIAIGQTTVSVVEGVTTATVPITRTGGSDGTVGVDYTTVDNTAVRDLDYRTVAGTLTFAPGETTKNVSIPILNDQLREGDETFNFSVDATSGGAALGFPRTATVTIQDDEPALNGFNFDFPDFANTASFTFNGNAARADNALRITPAATFQAGSAFYQDAIAIDADTSFSSQFQFRLSGGQGNTGADGFTFMLQNNGAGANALGDFGGYLGYDDKPAPTNAQPISPSLAIEFDTYQNTWDPSANQVAVLRDGNVTQMLVTRTPTIDLNSGNPLNAWVDYNGNTNQLEVYLANSAAKPTSALFSQTVDLAAILGSSAYLGFSGGTGGRTNVQDIQNWRFASSDALASPTVGFSQPTYTVDENAGTATIAVTRSISRAGGVTVDYTTSNGTATAGADYTAASGTLTFAAGENRKTFTVPITNDTRAERNETINLTLSNANGADLGAQNTSVLSLIDEDPGNFAQDTVVSGLTQPTAFDWSPDNRYLYIAQQNGVVRVFDQQTNSLLDDPFIDISTQVNNVQDRGLLGLAVHPDFPNNPYIYLAYTYDPPELQNLTGLAAPDGSGNRVARVTRVRADAGTNFTTAVANSEEVILGKNSTFANISRPDVDSTDNLNIAPSAPPNGTGRDAIPVDSRSHSLGDIDFGTDGSLFVSIGDGTSFGRVDPRTTRTQNLDSLSGKILRINPETGEGYADNPFYNNDSGSNRSKVYSYGLRNPFRFAINDNTNEPFIADVGWTNWEEINTGRAANFGWPFYEGGNGTSLQTTGYRALPEAPAFYAANANLVKAPIFARSHADGAIAFIMGDFYTGTTFPDVYRGALFFNDFGRGTIDALLFDANGNVNSIKQFASDLRNIPQMTTGADSNLYFANRATGEIKRFRNLDTE